MQVVRDGFLNPESPNDMPNYAVGGTIAWLSIAWVALGIVGKPTRHSNAGLW